MRHLWILAAPLILHHSVLAQREQLQGAQALPLAARAYVVEFDPASQIETKAVLEGRVDVQSGVYRAVYRIEKDTPVLSSARATAKAYLEAKKAQFGVVFNGCATGRGRTFRPL